VNRDWPLPAPSTTPEPYTREELEAKLSHPSSTLSLAISHGGSITASHRRELARLLATARAALEDRERLDWLDGVLVGPLPEPPITYDDDTKLWTHADGRTFKTMREALDVARGAVPESSGRVSPNRGSDG